MQLLLSVAQLNKESDLAWLVTCILKYNDVFPASSLKECLLMCDKIVLFVKMSEQHAVQISDSSSTGDFLVQNVK